MIKTIKKLIHITIALIGLSGIILVHELGHLSFAKLFKVPVSTFSVGFGPTLAQTKINNTIYKINILPLGGFVKISQKGELNSLRNKPYYQKVLILSGGIIFNIILGLILLFISKYLPKDKSYNIKNLSADFKTILIPSKKKTQLKGPIGIINYISKSLGNGSSLFLIMLAFISFNLALFNLIPIPLFDGGQIALTTIEQILGTEIPNNLLYLINLFSMIIIAILFFYITQKDIKDIL